ncbi:hypothetical protein HYW75_05080 [Candidatus Pacearchaeota archaeon]|nr:hypothetical protein [Candidatus Pacearchaeota archaeon]
MAERVICEICKREFKDVDGLAQHNAAKHAHETENKTLSSNFGFNYKKLRNWVIVLVFIIGIIWLFSITIRGNNSCKTDPVTEINIGSHQNLALHIHTDLEIIIDNVAKEIPANIGIAPGLMRPLHTHDNSGEIHMEGPCVRNFKLGEFFQVWGKSFNSRCIFDFCTENGTLTMMVNGKVNTEFDNYIMRDQDEITIEFNSN